MVAGGGARRPFGHGEAAIDALRAAGRRLGTERASARRLAGLAYARAWRIANKPFFDALFGPETV